MLLHLPLSVSCTAPLSPLQVLDDPPGRRISTVGATMYGVQPQISILGKGLPLFVSAFFTMK